MFHTPIISKQFVVSGSIVEPPDYNKSPTMQEVPRQVLVNVVVDKNQATRFHVNVRRKA